MPKDKDVFKRCIYNAAHLKLPQRSAMQGARLVCAITEAAQDGKQIDLEFIAGGKGKALDRAISTFLNEWGRYLRNCANGKQNQGKAIVLERDGNNQPENPENVKNIENGNEPENGIARGGNENEIVARWMLDSCSIDARTPTENQEDTADCLPPHIYTCNHKKKNLKENFNFDTYFRYHESAEKWELWRKNFYSVKNCANTHSDTDLWGRYNCDVQIIVIRHILDNSERSVQMAEQYGGNAEKIACLGVHPESAFFYSIDNDPGKLTMLLTSKYVYDLRKWKDENEKSESEILEYITRGLQNLS